MFADALTPEEQEKARLMAQSNFDRAEENKRLFRESAARRREPADAPVPEGGA